MRSNHPKNNIKEYNPRYNRAQVVSGSNPKIGFAFPGVWGVSRGGLLLGPVEWESVGGNSTDAWSSKASFVACGYSTYVLRGFHELFHEFFHELREQAELDCLPMDSHWGWVRRNPGEGVAPCLT